MSSLQSLRIAHAQCSQQEVQENKTIPSKTKNKQTKKSKPTPLCEAVISFKIRAMKKKNVRLEITFQIGRGNGRNMAFWALKQGVCVWWGRGQEESDLAEM